MPTTPYLPNGGPLKGVDREATLVADSFRGAHTQLTGRHATRAAVLAALATHQYAHFACHGAIDADTPAASGLCLDDRRLTIEELSRCDLPRGAAQLAFLSACDSSAASVFLLDEAITIAAATQLAGFRHVIATMWPISDGLAPRVARDVYKTLAPTGASDNGRVARALHAAVRNLRRNGGSPVQWGPYVHIGP